MIFERASQRLSKAACRDARLSAERGDVSCRPMGRPPGSGKLSAHVDFLVEVVESIPDITGPELAAALAEARGVTAHPSSVKRALLAEGFTYKKSLLATERGRADVKAKRREWITRRQPRMRQEPHRLGFVPSHRCKQRLPGSG